MWKLFQQEMGTVILKTCGTAKHGKSRAFAHEPQEQPGDLPSAYSDILGTAEYQASRGKHPRPLEQPLERASVPENSSWKGRRLSRREDRSHGSFKASGSEANFVPGEWKLPQGSCLSTVLFLICSVPTLKMCHERRGVFVAGWWEDRNSPETKLTRQTEAHP